jgi:hypothetical protein
MKTNKYFVAVVLICSIFLSLSFTATAQRRYGNNHYNNYGRHYSSRPYVSVNIGRPYGYGYRPYYNRPVYNYHQPVYRSPYSYVHFGPSFGFRINVLPFGYYPFYYGGYQYYYNDGIYYRPYSGGGYEVAAPPLGATVKRLPSGTKVTVIDGVKYYELGGTFYQEEINEKNKAIYKVVGTDGVLNTGNDNDNGEAINEGDAVALPQDNPAPVTNTAIAPAPGTRFDKLPEGSKAVVIKKEKYYVSPAGVYYQEVIDGNNIRYEVTGGSSDSEK